MRHLDDTHAKQQERQKGCDSDNAGYNDSKGFGHIRITSTSPTQLADKICSLR